MPPKIDPDQARETALREALDAIPSASADPDEGPYDRGFFEGVMCYFRKICALAATPPQPDPQDAQIAALEELHPLSPNEEIIFGETYETFVINGNPIGYETAQYFQKHANHQLGTITRKMRETIAWLGQAIKWSSEERDKKIAALEARVREMEEENAKQKALIDAVKDWFSDRQPEDPGDALLMKAIWTFDGDNIKPCPECDGECGESCAPCTVAEAHAYFDQYRAEWFRKRGIEDSAALSKEAGR